VKTAERALRPPSVDLAIRHEARLVLPLLILSILALWILPMGSSFGLDESGNWWVLKDGFREMVERAAVWPGGQSVLFNLIAMGTRAVAGDSDFALRLPAVVMMIGTLVLIYRLGARLGGPLAAALSCLAFVTMREVIYVASVLRPYALGVLLATGAMLALIRWLDTGRWGSAILYVILAALTPYANYLHGSMFLVHVICAAMRIYRKNTPVNVTGLLGAWLACGILMIPLLREALALYSRRGQEAYLNPPNAAEAFASIVPPVLAGSLLLAVFVHIILRRAPVRIAHADPDLLWVASVWAVVPPLVLVALGVLSDVELFAGRYYVVNAPGVALSAGILLRSVDPTRFARTFAIILAFFAISYYGFQEGFLRGLFDYRGATEYIRSQVTNLDTPVIVVSGYTEASYFPNVTDPVLSQALLAPALRYRMPGRLIPTPGLLTAEAEIYMESLYSQTLQNQPRFILTGLLGSEFYRAWLVGRTANSGFHMKSRREFSGVLVMVFEKNGG